MDELSLRRAESQPLRSIINDLSEGSTLHPELRTNVFLNIGQQPSKRPDTNASMFTKSPPDKI